MPRSFSCLQTSLAELNQASLAVALVFSPMASRIASQAPAFNAGVSTVAQIRLPNLDTDCSRHPAPFSLPGIPATHPGRLIEGEASQVERGMICGRRQARLARLLAAFFLPGAM